MLGYHVILYASEENEACHDELVTVITKEEQRVLLDGLEYQYAALHNRGYPLWALANNRAIIEIGKRKQSKDFICIIGGTSQEPIANAHPDLMTVEYSIGYVSSFAKYRVYESEIWRAMTHGYQNMVDGRFFDAVIPLFFDERDFKFRGRDERDDFGLFVGRIVPKKGIEIACKACELAGVKLKVVGHGDPSLVTHGAEYVGAVDDATRNELMSRAKFLICPTTYVEPFGSVVVEAAMCGTPSISTNFGGFIETVEHGKTGFRCDYMGEFVRAIGQCDQLDHDYIRRRAIEKYSIPAVSKQYQQYFERLMLLWDGGWDSIK